MNQRQISLVTYLLEAQGYCRTCDLAELLGCSQRTIRNDIPHITHYLTQIGCSCAIESKTGSGLRLLASNHESMRILTSLKTNKVETSSSLYRFYHGLLLIAKHPHHYSLDTLAHELFCSKQTLSEDIKHWNDLLSSYETHLSTRGALDLKGPEINIRFFMVYFFYQLADAAMKHKIEPLIFGERLTSLVRFLEDMQKNTERSYSLNSKHQIMLYLEIMMSRIKEGKVIGRLCCEYGTDTTHSKTETALSPGIKTLCRQLEHTYGISVPELEAYQLQEIFLVSNRGYVNQVFQRETPTQEAYAYAQCLKEQLMLGLMTTREMSPELTRELTSVINYALIRKNHNLNSAIAHTASRSVHWDNLPTTLMLFSALLKTAQITHKTLFTTDYTRICMLLTPYARKYFKQNRWTCALVVNGGIEMAEFLKESVKASCPEIDIPFILDSQNTIQALKAHRLDAVDFFVGFESLDIDRPYLQVSHAYSRHDTKALLDMLDKLEYPRKTAYEIPVLQKHLAITKPKSLYSDLFRTLKDLNIWQDTSDAFIEAATIGSFAYNEWMVIALVSNTISDTQCILFDTDGFMLVTGKRLTHVALLLVHSKDSLRINAVATAFKKVVTRKGITRSTSALS